jgi:hypothetical protein
MYFYIYKLIFFSNLKSTNIFHSGPPSKIRQIPRSGIEGVSIGQNLTLEVEILSNPQPIVTLESWSFIDYNGTLQDCLPDNVNSYIEPGTGRLTIKVKLTIINTDKINYGNYTLNTGNRFGNMTPVILGVAPKGRLINCQIMLHING